MKSKEKFSYGALRTQPQYLKLIAGAVVNRFGDCIDAIAFSLLMYAVTGSASLMALVLTINYLPSVLIQPIAGVLTERMNPKRVMALCDFGRGANVLIVALLYAAGRIGTPVIVLSVLVSSTLEAIATPCGVAVVPRILDESLYTTGVALRNTLCRISELAGLVCAGGVVALLGTPAALAIDAGTFFFSAAMNAWLRLSPAEAAAEPQTSGGVRRVLAGLKEGFVSLMGRAPLRAMLALGMAINLSAVPFSVFMTPYVTDTLGGSAAALSASEISMIAGMALGGVFIPKLSKLSSRTQVLVSGLNIALNYAGIGLLPLLPTPLTRVIGLCALNVLFGVANAALSVFFSSSFMRAAPKEQLGRLSGILNALLTCAMPVGSLVCSGLAAFLPLSALFLFTGVLSAGLFFAMSRARIYGQL